MNGTFGLARAMVGTMTNFHDQMHIDDPSVLARTMFVDTGSVKATDFDIDEPTQAMLFTNGRRAARKFLSNWDLDRYIAEFRTGATIDLTAEVVAGRDPLSRERGPSISSRSVPGFLPSTSGFRFANDFPHIPVRRIGIPGVVSIPIGDAANGLCGGMAFAARDYFEAERPCPDDTSAPGAGSLFDFLCDRLFDSFDLPLGPARYLALMSPLLSDGETIWSRMGLTPHGRAWRMVRDEWPKVRADIDAGHPSALGLIKVKSTDPRQLKQDHQVLAYGYDVEDGILRLRLYDPNQPGRDDVVLSLPIADPSRPAPITTSPPAGPVYAFFRVTYSVTIPP